MLWEKTLLTVEGGDYPVRLSYVLADDSGCIKGLTVRSLLPDPSQSTNGAIPAVRPRVHVNGGAVVGILDPERSGMEPGEENENQDRSPISSGALTCIFTIPKGVIMNYPFRPPGGRCIADLADCAGVSAHLISEVEIGTILDQLNYLQWKQRCVYPLLRLKRSEEDLENPDSLVRNGAMVSTRDGALVGIIVSIFDRNKFYAVAPIRNVLEWHQLHVMQQLEWRRFHEMQHDVYESRLQGSAPLWMNQVWSHSTEPDPRLRDLVEA